MGTSRQWLSWGASLLLGQLGSAVSLGRPSCCPGPRLSGRPRDRHLAFHGWSVFCSSSQSTAALCGAEAAGGQEQPGLWGLALT